MHILYYPFSHRNILNYVFQYQDSERDILLHFTTLYPPLSSSGQSSWLHIRKAGFNSRCCQIFWEVVGLEQGPLSLVSTIEMLLGRKVAASAYKSENTAVGIGHADYTTHSIRKIWH
jgi:hypothetical protein